MQGDKKFYNLEQLKREAARTLKDEGKDSDYLFEYAKSGAYSKKKMFVNCAVHEPDDSAERIKAWELLYQIQNRSNASLLDDIKERCPYGYTKSSNANSKLVPWGTYETVEIEGSE